MIYTLKDYQRKAVDELKGYIQRSLEGASKKNIVFKSPTGSGKTFMASSLFEELASENEITRFCIMWCCPGKGELHKQSFNNVKEYLGGNPVCSLLEDTFFGSRNMINNKEIVFINWEKLVDKDKETGKWINSLMKDQEGNNFINVIDETRRQGIKIVLVVDESHIGANVNARIMELRDTIICPNVTLEMSATPLSAPDVIVDIEDVIAEGMIKEDVIVNEGITEEDRKLADKDSELIVLEKAYEKREELLAEFKNIGSLVNPLVLIQIPNVDAGEDKKRIIRDFLNEKGITEENGKLKLWCDKHDSFDKKRIKIINDVTEYLVFKTAVATGWDCPRAQILVKFREGKSETFEIQTLGRILRTPEAKSYDNQLLDNAYIYTNIQDFETKKDTYCPNRIKTEITYFKKGYDKLKVWGQTKLKSFYRSREGNYNSADSRFGEYYENVFMRVLKLEENDKYAFWTANQQKLEDAGLDLSLEAKDTLLEETVIDVKGVDNEQNITGGQVNVRMSSSDVHARFYTLIRENLSELQYARSKDPIAASIITTLSKFYNPFSRNDKVDSIQRIVVNNYQLFSEILSEATRAFRDMLQLNAVNKGVTYEFKIEDKRAYCKDTSVKLNGFSKSLYQPLFMPREIDGHVNHLEKDFLQYLEDSDVVTWYWKNSSEVMRVNFGIKYNNGMITFQPDFIVKFADGRVGIFDTKGVGFNVDDTKKKAEALHDYLNTINFNRGYDPRVVGGIVIKRNNQFYLYDEAEYHDYDESTEQWHNFNELLREVENQVDIERYLKSKKE